MALARAVTLRVVVADLALAGLAGFAGARAALDAGAELPAGLAEEAAGLADDAAGLADEAAGLAVELAGLAEAAAALVSGLGLAEAAGAVALVSRIAEVTAVVPAAEPACRVPAAAAPAGAVLPDTGSVQGMAAGAAAIRCAAGASIPMTLMATTETPANTLAAGAPAARIFTAPPSRRGAGQRLPRSMRPVSSRRMCCPLSHPAYGRPLC